MAPKRARDGRPSSFATMDVPALTTMRRALRRAARDCGSVMVVVVEEEEGVVCVILFVLFLVCGVVAFVLFCFVYFVLVERCEVFLCRVGPGGGVGES